MFNRWHRPWTKADDKVLSVLWGCSDISTQDIAVKLRTSKNSVCNRARKLGLHRPDNAGQFQPTNKLVGVVDKNTIRLAKRIGLHIIGGGINKKDKRVRITTHGLFPGAHRSGYALRSRVVWWLNTGEVIVGCDIDIHHINGIRHDDCFDNLEKLTHIEHTKHHNPKTCLIDAHCLNCNGIFQIEQWRLKDPSRGRFCSQECYHNKPRQASHKSSISNGLKRAYKEGVR